MRPYRKSDKEYIVNALLSEDLALEDMTFETDQTFVTEIGFFSYRMEKEYPRLGHFFVDKDKRSLKNAHKLIKDFKQLLIKDKCLFFIALAPKDKKFFNRFIQYIKGTMYEENDEDIFYYVPLFGRVNR